MTFKEIRENSGMNLTQFSEYFEIPYRTVQNWESGATKCPDYVIKLIEHRLNSENKEMFQFDEDYLIVDAAFFDDHYQNAFIVKIKMNYYKASGYRTCKNGQELCKGLKIMINYQEPAEKMDFMDYEYRLHHIVPREGFRVKIGRCITVKEFEQIKKHYSLQESDISEEFTDTVGGFYGKKYAKTFTSVQIKIPDSNGVSLEKTLKERGIEASNIAFGRVNIRVR